VPVLITTPFVAVYVVSPTCTRPSPVSTPRPRRNPAPLSSSRFTATVSSQSSVASSRIRSATGVQSGVIVDEPAIVLTRPASRSVCAAAIIIFEGTQSSVLAAANWREYEFPAKPGDPHRRPPFIAPYQPRLDWEIWFAAMTTYNEHPWTVHLVWKLLHNDPGALSLLANNPFPDAPPHYIRAELYRYRFTPPGENDGSWWKRERLGPWLPPLSTDQPDLRRFLELHRWLPSADAP